MSPFQASWPLSAIRSTLACKNYCNTGHMVLRSSHLRPVGEQFALEPTQNQSVANGI